VQLVKSLFQPISFYYMIFDKIYRNTRVQVYQFLLTVCVRLSNIMLGKLFVCPCFKLGFIFHILLLTTNKVECSAIDTRRHVAFVSTLTVPVFDAINEITYITCPLSILSLSLHHRRFGRGCQRDFSYSRSSIKRRRSSHS
jgi:hypothetical protein